MAKIGINISTGSLQKEEIVVGIDLGTTNSLVAIIHPESKTAVALKESDGTSLVPSIVHFNKSGVATVGEQAKQFLLSDPENTIFSVKRLLGKSYNDIRNSGSMFAYRMIDDNEERLVKVKAADKIFSPIELSSFILKELKSRAEHIIKTTVTKAVITVPAYFNDSQRQATRDAGKLAGLDVLRIVNEPTAASLAYGLGLNKNEEKTIAVYDLGGGTFDISILKIANGIFEVLSTNGDTNLGGDDFDNVIVRSWVLQHNFSQNALGDDPQWQAELRLTAEKAKKHLSLEEQFETTSKDYHLTICKKHFESLIEPLINKTIECSKKALQDASLTAGDIDEIIMVGGSTRIPAVKNAVETFFGKRGHDELNPDEVVALGAAIQADILAGNNKDFLLLDITPLSLGIETMGGLMDVLISRNSKIPTKASRQYTTQKDGQNKIRISVFQGERDLVKDNRKLAEFNFTGIPAMPAGLPKVEVSFFINADGILVIKTKELRSGVEQSIEITPEYGLTDAEVERMLQDSIHHAKEDIVVKALVETTTEASAIIETTENFIRKNKSYLKEDEITACKSALMELKQVMNENSKDLIRQKIELLNEITRPFAERVMDIAIGVALKGNKI